MYDQRTDEYNNILLYRAIFLCINVSKTLVYTNYYRKHKNMGQLLIDNIVMKQVKSCSTISRIEITQRQWLKKHNNNIMYMYTCIKSVLIFLRQKKNWHLTNDPQTMLACCYRKCLDFLHHCDLAMLLGAINRLYLYTEIVPEIINPTTKRNPNSNPNPPHK